MASSPQTHHRFSGDRARPTAAFRGFDPSRAHEVSEVYPLKPRPIVQRRWGFIDHHHPLHSHSSFAPTNFHGRKQFFFFFVVMLKKIVDIRSGASMIDVGVKGTSLSCHSFKIEDAMQRVPSVIIATYHNQLTHLQFNFYSNVLNILSVSVFIQLI